MVIATNVSYTVASGKSIFGGIVSENIARLWIVAGQSNARGLADISGAPLSTNPVVGVSTFKRTSKLSGVGSWQPLNHTTNIYDASGDGKFGPELQLMKRAASEHYSTGPENCFLVKVTQGGTSLGVDWADGSDLRNSLIYHIESAIADLQANNDFDVVKVMGLYWDQGEWDARFQSLADSYESNLTAFIADIRSHVGSNDLPIVLRKHDPSIATNDYTPLDYITTVIAAQESVADSDLNVFLTNEVFTNIGDGLHLDAVAQNKQGDVVFETLETTGGRIINGA